jgi:O-antigen/teichoic acid export membrane protein
MPKEGTGARVVRNTLANGLGAFTAIGLSLILTPFLIHHLGLEAYGIWVLAQSLTFFGGYAAIADLGVEAAAVRYIAEARAEGDREALNQTVTSALLFFSGVAVVFIPLLILLADPLTQLFDVDPVYHRPAIYVFTFVAAQLIFDLPGRAFFAVLEGAQQFATFQLVLLVRALVQAGLFVAVIVADLGIGSLGAVSFISSAVMFFAALILAKRAVPELHLRRRYVSRASLKKLFSFGGGLFVIRIVGTLYRHMDKIIVGIALGPRLVTIYEIANQIHLATQMAQSIAASALTPATAFLRNERDVLRDMYLRGTCYTVAVSLPVVVAAFVFAGPFIESWLGRSLLEAVEPTRLFLVYLAFVVFHIVGATMAVALGRLRFLLVVTTANLLVNFALSIALVHPLGVEGVILGTLIAQGVFFPPLLWFFLREFGVSFRTWLRGVVAPSIPGLVIQVATAFPLLYVAERFTNLGLIALLGIVSVASSIAGFLLLGLSRDQRELLVTTVRDAVRTRERASQQAAESLSSR